MPRFKITWSDVVLYETEVIASDERDAKEQWLRGDLYQHGAEVDIHTHDGPFFEEMDELPGCASCRAWVRNLMARTMRPSADVVCEECGTAERIVYRALAGEGVAS